MVKYLIFREGKSNRRWLQMIRTGLTCLFSTGTTTIRENTMCNNLDENAILPRDLLTTAVIEDVFGGMAYSGFMGSFPSGLADHLEREEALAIEELCIQSTARLLGITLQDLKLTAVLASLHMFLSKQQVLSPFMWF